MRILVSGSNGLVGKSLVRSLAASGHEAIRLVRPASRGGMNGVMWDPAAGSIDREGLEGFDAVVHLAGENIADKRWSPAQKERIRNSRVVGTALLANALAETQAKPSVFVCASASGYFGDRDDEVLSDDAPPGRGFLAEVTAEWERAAAPAADAGIRVVNMRIGIVLSAAAGMLKRVLPLFELGLGGKLGSGSQYMSWITRADLTDAIMWMIECEDMAGGVNVTSPNPVSNAEFTRSLARAVHRPAMFIAPRFALRIGMGEMADTALGSIRMSPDRLIKSGFVFRHHDIENALRWALTDRDP